MDGITTEVTIEIIDGKPTVVLTLGKSVAYLTANESISVAEALAEACGLVEGMNEEAGIVEPDAISMVSYGEGNQPESLADSLEECERVDGLPKKIIH
jgi:hypothetical protein